MVYKLDPPGINSRTLPAKANKKYEKKYIHEIAVEPMTKRTNLQELCDRMCENESYYLNPSIIKRAQVFNILITLYEKITKSKYEDPKAAAPIKEKEKPAPQPSKETEAE